jgi:C1A family cysteine protease
MQHLGYLPDLPDPRDADHAARLLKLAAPPPSFSLRDSVVSILDQNPLGSCVANAITQAILTRLIVQGERDAELTSRLFAYWHSRNQHGDVKEDSGTYLRTCIKVLNALGRPPERVWPYVPARFAEKPPPLVLSHAHDKRVAKYHRVDEVGTARIPILKAAVAAGMPFVFGTLVSVPFTQNKGPLVVGPPLNEVIAGGHAMVGIAYDEVGPDVANSWSKSWRDGGFIKLTWEYLTWSATQDIWIIDI